MGLAHNGERRIHDGVMTIRSGPGEPAASRLPRRAGGRSSGAREIGRRLA